MTVELKISKDIYIFLFVLKLNCGPFFLLTVEVFLVIDVNAYRLDACMHMSSFQKELYLGKVIRNNTLEIL